MKCLKVQKEISKSSKVLQISPFIDKRGLTCARGRNGKIQLNVNERHPILFQWKNHVIEISLRKEHKEKNQEGTEHLGNIVHQRFRIIGVTITLRSIKNECMTFRIGRAQTMIPVMAVLPTEGLVSSTAFVNVEVLFWPFVSKKWAQK